MLSLVRIGMPVVPSRASGALLRRACVEAPGRGSRDDVREVVLGIERAARRIPGATCLIQALTGWLMLSRRSIPSTVRIGVARPDAKLSAHAWLEQDGRVVLGSEGAAAHTSFPSPPP